MLKPELIPTRLVEHAERTNLPVVEPPRTTAFRNVRALFYLLDWAFTALWLKLRGRSSPVVAAARLSAFLQKMGALWVKAGQLISLRSDIFPPDFCVELAKLQYQATAFPWPIARQAIEDQLGRPLDYAFDEFEEQPFAAASISQVHRAHLKTENVWVAVKVQRPDIQQTFARDLAFFRNTFRIFKRLNILPHLRWDDMYWEIQQIVQEETDYRYEESNLRRMKKTLRKHDIYVPKVFSRYSGRRVLVMEFIHGELMSEFIRMSHEDPRRLQAWLAENKIQPELLGIRLLKSFLRQLLEDNLFHGDLHPGNIILLRNSRIAFIDLGTVGTFETSFLALYKLVIYAISSRDYVKAADILFLMCEELPQVDVEQVKADVVRAYRAWDARTPLRGLGYHEKSIGSVSQETGRIMYEHRIVASWQFMKASRTLGTLDASLNYLIPDMDHGKVSRAYQKGAQRRYWKRLRSIGIAKMVTKAIGGIEEFVLFEGAKLRRQAQVFQRATSKVSDFVAALFRTLARVVVFAGLVAFLAYLDQHHFRVVSGLHRFSIYRRLTGAVPLMTGDEWLFLVLAALYLRHFCRNMYRRFSEKDIQVTRND